MQLKKATYLLKGGMTGLLLLVLTTVAVVAQVKRDISLQDHLVERGIASYYADSFDGRLTSAGDIFTNKGMTAASNTLPLGTTVKVTNLRNHKWVVVTINDRMNKYNRRTIDLTRHAAGELGMIHHGVARVKVEVIPQAFYKFYHISPDELVVTGKNGRDLYAGL